MTAPTVPPVTDEERPTRVRTRRDARRLRMPFAVRRVRDWLREPSPWAVAPVAALWAAGIGLVVVAVPVVLLWLSSSAGLDAFATMRGSALLFAMAHTVPVTAGGVGYTLLPIGLVLLPIALLAYAGSWTARRAGVRSWRDLAVATATAAVCYAAVVAVVASVGALGDAQVSWASAALRAAILAVLAFGGGAWRRSGLRIGDGPTARAVVTVTRASALGALALLGCGALLAAASLVIHIDDGIEMTRALHAGLGGGALLLLIGAGYVPVLAVWGMAYLLGTGVVIGPGIAVSAFVPVTAPTQLPPFPLLAALPSSSGPAAWFLPAIGVGVGVLVGIAVARGTRAESRLLRLGLAALASGGVGLLVAAACALASGALGDLRLASLGPSPATAGVLAMVLTVLGAVPSAVLPAPPERLHLHVPDPADDLDPVAATKGTDYV